MTVTLWDYADLNNKQGDLPNYVKKITVKISYMFKSQEKSVELSTALSKQRENNI